MPTETTEKERDAMRFDNESQRQTEDAYFCSDEVTSDQIERLLNDADKCAKLEKGINSILESPHSSTAASIITKLFALID